MDFHRLIPPVVPPVVPGESNNTEEEGEEEEEEDEDEDGEDPLRFMAALISLALCTTTCGNPHMAAWLIP